MFVSKSTNKLIKSYLQKSLFCVHLSFITFAIETTKYLSEFGLKKMLAPLILFIFN